MEVRIRSTHPGHVDVRLIFIMEGLPCTYKDPAAEAIATIFARERQRYDGAYTINVELTDDERTALGAQAIVFSRYDAGEFARAMLRGLISSNPSFSILVNMPQAPPDEAVRLALADILVDSRQRPSWLYLLNRDENGARHLRAAFAEPYFQRRGAPEVEGPTSPDERAPTSTEGATT